MAANTIMADAIASIAKLHSRSRKLNIGCGRRYHADWINLDLTSRDASVVQWDIIEGLPFADNSLHAVYHSHVLEHLRPGDGERLMAECFRVLAPGGVLRVVVPDLEKIAELYLDTHRQAWRGDDTAAIDYNWMKLELLDQLVRTQSGGRMGPYMANETIRNSDFVRARVGDEFSICRCKTPITEFREKTWSERIKERTLDLRVSVVHTIVRWLLGRSEAQAFSEALFREQGEIHRWMYDRFSLKELCVGLGFEGFEVCTAFNSSISGYESFELDAEKGAIRKPDSLFIECVKPARLGVVGILDERGLVGAGRFVDSQVV